MANPIEEEELKRRKRHDVYEQYRQYAEDVDNADKKEKADKVKKKETADAKSKGPWASKNIQHQPQQSAIGDLFKKKVQNPNNDSQK